ncbi:MAG: hypothetical protein AAF726_22325 [Planctomycetota bacterium]
MTLFHQLGGPLSITALDCSAEGSGAPILLHDQAWERGDVCQIGKPGLAEINGGFRSVDGPLGHAGTVANVNAQVDTSGIFAIVTNEAVTEDQEGNVCVKGIVRARIAMANGETLAFGSPVYVNKTADALEPVAPTNGRAVGFALEPVADQGGAAVVEILIMFNGIPAFIGG